MAKAERDIAEASAFLRNEEPQRPLTLEELRMRTERANRSAAKKKGIDILRLHDYRRIGIAACAVILAFLGLFPLNFREKVGYEISISGVDPIIATDSKGIVPFFDALGMEKDRTANLMDSLEIKEIHLKVGECSETCNLKISDLKSEKDVNLIIDAIIKLGCCEIDHVFPIYRNESSPILWRATRKLFS